MEYIKIGKIVNAVGIKGEVKVYNYSDPDRYDYIDRILVENRKIRGEERFVEYHVKSSRTNKNMVVLKLKEVDDRNKAEALKESDVYITDAELRTLPKDTFYIRDLIGCSVFDVKGESKTNIGTISDVIQNGPQDVYEIKLPNGNNTYVPAVKQFIKEIDIDGRSVYMDLIPGFIEDAVEA